MAQEADREPVTREDAESILAERQRDLADLEQDLQEAAKAGDRTKAELAEAAIGDLKLRIAMIQEAMRDL